MPTPVDPADALRALEHRRTRALVERDLPTLEALHAPEYELVTPAGRVFGRERYLAAIAREPFYTGWALGDIAVRLGTDSAVLRYQAQLSFPSGGVLRCWHLDTYERRGGAWQAVWSQATPLPAEPLVVRPAGASDRLPLLRLLELYQHDLSDLWDQDLDPHGDYGYELDRFLRREAAWAYLFEVEGRLAGCALVDTRVRVAGDDFWMDQFFVLKKYRRQGVGAAAARQVMGRHPGRWQVGQMPGNAPALAFWRRVAAGLAPAGFEERQLVDGPWQGTVQRFAVPPAA